MSSVKPVGTIKNTQARSIGKLYQTPRQTAPVHTALTHQNTHTAHATSTAPHKRGDSVGKIYTTNRSSSREPFNPSMTMQKSTKGWTCKDEMQDKLVQQIFSNRTVQKTRYNYLAQPYQPILKNIIKNGVRPQETTLKDKDLNFQKDPKVESDQKYGKITAPSEKLIVDSIKQAGNENKQNGLVVAVMKKRDVKSAMGVISRREVSSKEDLGDRVKEMIMHYEVKNREHSLELQKLQLPTKDSLVTPPIPPTSPENQQTPKFQPPQPSQTSLKQSMNNLLALLIQSNQKSSNLPPTPDDKLQPLWQSLHNQLTLDEKLRICRYFLTEQNKPSVLNLINEKRIKKIDGSVLQVHTEEYDPFLIEKISQMTAEFKDTHKEREYLQWVADSFVRSYEEAERHWLRYFSQETMSTTINTYELSQESQQPKTAGSSQQPTIRDLTRLLSTIFKSNLRNRNIYQLHCKLKSMSYTPRLFELLSLKSGDSPDPKKPPSK